MDRGVWVLDMKSIHSKVLFMSCSPLTMIPPLILGWDIVLHTACGFERCIHSM